MKMKRIKIYMGAIALALAIQGSHAQQAVDYATFLEEVASRSPQLSAADKGHYATVRGLRTGLAPDDPEVGLEYYFTNETRYELAIEQRFDFPTVYHQRNKISKLGISRAEQDYGNAKRGILIQVSDNYLALHYTTERAKLLQERQQGLQALVDHYKESQSRGQGTLLELEGARMMLIEVEHELAACQADLDEAAETLRQLNGGLAVPAAGYPQLGFSGTREEFVEAAMLVDYELQAAAIDTLIAKRELKLSRQEWIPKLKVGYKVEMEGSKGTNALLAGISIPLWQNSGKTKYAKALGQAAKAQHVAAEAAARTRLGALYNRYELFSGVVNRITDDETHRQYPELLKMALDAGTMSAINYLLALDDWYTAMDNRMATEYQAAQTAALMAICLM